MWVDENIDVKLIELESSLCPLFYIVRRGNNPLEVLQQYSDKFDASVCIGMPSTKSAVIHGIMPFLKIQSIVEIVFSMISDPLLQSFGERAPLIVHWHSSKFRQILRGSLIGKPVSEFYCPELDGEIYQIVAAMNMKMLEKHQTRTAIDLENLPERLDLPVEFMFHVDKEGIIFLSMGLRYTMGSCIGCIMVRLNFNIRLIYHVFEWIYNDEDCESFSLDEEFIVMNYPEVLNTVENSI